MESVDPNVNFTFLSGSLDTADAFTFYDISPRVIGLGSITYAVAVPVPEADTSAMLLMGLGVIGFMARRRKNIQA